MSRDETCLVAKPSWCNLRGGEVSWKRSVYGHVEPNTKWTVINEILNSQYVVELIIETWEEIALGQYGKRLMFEKSNSL